MLTGEKKTIQKKVYKVKGRKLWALKFDFTLALLWPAQRVAEWVYEKLLLSLNFYTIFYILFYFFAYLSTEKCSSRN